MSSHKQFLFAVIAGWGCMLSAAMAQECMKWEDRSPPPQHREDHAMAFDSVRNVTLAFGGRSSTAAVLRDDLWQWDGATWQEIPPTGDWPAGRAGHSMVFDSSRGVAVMFGGSLSYPSDRTDETWEWNGSTWSLRPGGGPSARRDHAAAFDSDRNVMVVFGGACNDSCGDTWEWDGTAWTLRSTTGPSPRSEHCMAYDSQRQVTVLYGGSEGAGGFLTDTWEWDGTSWTQVLSSGPNIVTCTMAFDAARGKSVMVDTPSTWERSSGGWVLVSTDGPTQYRASSALAFDANRAVGVLMGGGGDLGSLRETWEWDGANWVDRTAPSAGPWLQYPIAAFDSVRQVAVVADVLWVPACPECPGFMLVHATWEWDGENWALRARGDQDVTPQDISAMAFDDARGVTVAFQGSEQGNETWEWDGDAWALRTSAGPSARRGPTMAYDSWRDRVLLFGGTVSCEFDPDTGNEICQRLEDLWAWDGSEWELLSASGPPPRAGAALAFDSMRGTTVVTGGFGEQPSFLCSGPLTDTWEWDGWSWAFRMDDGELLRWTPVAAYDPHRARTVVRTGLECDISGYPGTWEWDGTGWSERPDFGPGRHFAVAPVYDPSRRALISFGDENDSWPWELLNDCSCAAPVLRPYGERFANCAGACYAAKNRYLSFAPPALPGCGSAGVALRVTMTQMPGAEDCPNIPDFSSAQGAQMWVGPQVAAFQNTDIPIYALQPAPLFRDWTTTPGGLIHVSDCNIVPCASYTVEAIADTEYPGGAYSPPLVLTTAARWGDVPNGSAAPNGTMNASDIATIVDCVKGLKQRRPYTWCDIRGPNSAGGANGIINAFDIAAAVDANKGLGYTGSPPTAPAACPVSP